MRELKFRAWNGESMEYGGFSIHATGKIINDFPGICDVTEDSEVMQFAGLKDKNGKDIYEGDILRYYVDTQNETLVNSVHIGDTNAFLMKDNNSDFYQIPVRAIHLESEVIGNIYQNKELL